MKTIIKKVWGEVSEINNFWILFYIVVLSILFSFVISGHNQITMESLIAMLLCFPLTVVLEITLLISNRNMEILFVAIGIALLYGNIVIQNLWLCIFAVGFTISALFIGIHHKYHEKKLFW